jgi:hypothetical protein
LRRDKAGDTEQKISLEVYSRRDYHGVGSSPSPEGLTAHSFLIKAIFASSPAVVGLDILVAVYINQSIFDFMQHA